MKPKKRMETILYPCVYTPLPRTRSTTTRVECPHCREMTRPMDWPHHHEFDCEICGGKLRQCPFPDPYCGDYGYEKG